LTNQNKNGDLQVDSNILHLPLTDIHGVITNLSKFPAKAYLLVNIASKCGFRYQYSSLQNLYDDYRERGLIVCGFPSNDFANQEPKKEKEIESYCKTEYGVTFPLFAKIHVKGQDIHPIYDFLTKHEKFGGKIKWNFSKFVLGQAGHIVGRFSPFTNPSSKRVRKTIQAELRRDKDANHC